MDKERWENIKSLKVLSRTVSVIPNQRRQLRKQSGLSKRQWRIVVKEGRRAHKG